MSEPADPNAEIMAALAGVVCPRCRRPTQAVSSENVVEKFWVHTRDGFRQRPTHTRRERFRAHPCWCEITLEAFRLLRTAHKQRAGKAPFA